MQKTIAGIHFLKLEGTAEERLQQHATILGQNIRQGSLKDLALYNEWLIRRSHLLERFPLLQDLAVSFYHQVLLPMLDVQLPNEYKKLQSLMSLYAGIDPRVVQRALYQPDGMMLLSRLGVMKYIFRDFSSGGLPGCTSAAVLEELRSEGSGPLTCRNLDYPIIGAWENNTTALFHKPKEKNEIPHVSITTSGLHISGLTSMNTEGLTVAVHAHFGRKVSVRGLPIFIIGQEMITKAKTIDEAFKIAKSMKRIGNWAYVVTSAKENQAAVIEMTPNDTAIRYAKDGVLSHSNYFHTHQLQDTEALISGGVCDDHVGRFSRPVELIEKFRGSVTPEVMAQVLGDHYDPRTKEERVFGNIVSVVTTVKSVVMDPAAQKLWLSTGDESPMGMGDFLEVDPNTFWEKSEGENQFLKGSRPQTPGLQKAVNHYRKAYQFYNARKFLGDYRQKALEQVELAIKAYDGDAHLWMQLGLINFKLGNFDPAYNAFSRAKDMNMTSHTALVCKLFLARLYDLRGKRKKALDYYKLWRQADEPKLKRALQKGLIRPYKKYMISSMMLDLQFPDAHLY